MERKRWRTSRQSLIEGDTNVNSTNSVVVDFRLDIARAVFNDILNEITFEVIDGVVVGFIVNLEENDTARW